ncbi:MAG: class I adenylate-forming enzyme family protein [Acidimicrobiales bacterium]
MTVPDSTGPRHGLSREEATAALAAPGSPFEVAEAPATVGGGAGLPVGRPTRTWKHAPTSLPQILADSRRHGATTYLVHEGRRMTYEQHFRAAAGAGRVLRAQLGVRPGDRVAIAMANCAEWVIAFWAAASTGAVVVPLNAWWSGEELAYGIADSGTSVLVCDPAREARLAPHRAGLGSLRTVIVAGEPGDRPGAGGRERLAFGALVGGDGDEGDAGLPAVEVGPDDDATIFYTSGTTGRPLGALGSQRNICSNPMNLLYLSAREALRTGQDPAAAGPNILLLSVPLFHATGCHSFLVSCTLAGGTLVMMSRWDAGTALELIESEGVTSFGGVPSMVCEVLDHPDLARRDTTSVRHVSYGGAPAPPALVAAIGAHLPAAEPTNGYGLTETSALVTVNHGDDCRAKPTSVGLPLPTVELKVVDSLGQELPAGDPGELWVRGPGVVKGYWNRPGATAAAFGAGWHHTGDVARIDLDGFVHIVDRVKDVLIRGGENVYCVEIEAALCEHRAVAGAAVVGIPHHLLGEEVGAVVELHPGAHASAGELQAQVQSVLAEFKVPVRIWRIDGPLPRNPAGKVLKRQLRHRLFEDAGSGDSGSGKRLVELH